MIVEWDTSRMDITLFRANPSEFSKSPPQELLSKRDSYTPFALKNNTDLLSVALYHLVRFHQNCANSSICRVDAKNLEHKNTN
jgi:hypothetical protein